jgi:branched-chain amino acid aminotransferase
VTLWLNGKLIAEEEARIDPADRGFLLGDGLFETMATRHGKVIFGNLHLDRLQRGADALGLEMPFDKPALMEAVSSLLVANDLAKTERAAVRLTLTRGPAPRGLVPAPGGAPTLMIACFALSAPKPSVCAIIASGRRNELSPTANVKALPYLDQIMARREAAEAGADDAIMLNTQGKIACATAANLFLWDSNMLITPPLRDGCLAGTTRHMILEVAKGAGINAFEESITPSTLANVESAFLTNSLTGIQPLSEIANRKLSLHPKQQALSDALQQAEIRSISE